MDENLGDKAIPVWAIAQLLDKKDLQLPSFQRDAVWDEERVELLWDSLLRGIPIGNLIVAPSANLPKKDPAESRYGLASPSIFQETGSGECVLIDGQQRAIGIQQGLADWGQDRTFRLWVDVSLVQEEQKRKEHTVTNAFFLCTRGFPWGTGVSDAQRRELRTKLESEHPDQIKENGQSKPDYRLSLNYTRPAKAKLPIPFATVARWFISEVRVEDSLAENIWPEPKPLLESDIKHRITELIEGPNPIVAADTRDLWKRDRDKIEKWIIEKQDLIRQALYRKIFFELAFGGAQILPNPEDLGEVFNRINRLGKPLDGTDLFFSALKLRRLC